MLLPDAPIPETTSSNAMLQKSKIEFNLLSGVWLTLIITW